MDVLAGGVGSPRAERYTYEVDGWGVGELVVEDGLLLAHELPSPRRPAAADPAAHMVHRATRAAARAAAVVPPTSRVVPPNPPQGGTRPPGVTLDDDRTHVCADLMSTFVERVRQQLNGTPTSYDDLPLDLSWCTRFQAELAAALLAIPWGEIVSYGELAALAGRPGAARPAGSFCAQNRFALVMPCHRVVGATGIGGYGDSGVALKRRLLALENVEL